MALNKTVTNSHGIVTNYHRVDNAALRRDRLSCDLISYASKDYRATNMAAVRSKFVFNITLAEEESMGIRALCYKKIKELDDWKDAEDC